ncbi:quinone-dependent dihydroorotate dehydrogenase [Lichenicola sp.]|uniref:quinone-dependent dihydroorotate dehydrogenase n=1 Tax=Lichenicola sp. TaxID=2804529 RepID=UPI003B00A705
MTLRSSTLTLPLKLSRRLGPERAHRLAIGALSVPLVARVAGWAASADDDGLAVEALGRRFANPIGLAAGFDKDARVVRQLGRLGFGFVEAGTVTPRPQSGNPRPRLFRLPEDGAVINRMGFNNQGLDQFLERARRLRAGSGPGFPFGANVGINKEGADPLRDYAHLVRTLAPHADYLVINLSSPNTPGLRDLQQADRLRELLDAIVSAAPARPPVLVKLAPDLADESLPGIVEIVVQAGLDGLIVSNTLLARPPGLHGPHIREAGGLSGRPLKPRSTAMLAEVARLSAGRLTLIGCGGIETGSDILEKLQAGADLVQLYTAFAYEGPALLGRLKRELRQALQAGGWSSIGDARAAGRSVVHIAGER